MADKIIHTDSLTVDTSTLHLRCQIQSSSLIIVFTLDFAIIVVYTGKIKCNIMLL